jgi:predicted nucleotidyltransferase
MNENSLDIAVAMIRSQYSQAKILLFGSQAKGSSGKDSDIDLCVILDNPLQRTLDISRQIRKDIHPLLKQSMDILVYDKKTFDERSAFPLTLEAEIAESAREI